MFGSWFETNKDSPRNLLWRKCVVETIRWVEYEPSFQGAKRVWEIFLLMNNSVFGKTMENIPNRVNIRLVNNQKSLKKCVAEPNFDHCTVFSENLVAVQMKKTELVFNKPVYLGMSILDLSKTLMYDFHYYYIKKKCGSKASLFFTDADSLCYEIEAEDFFKDISADAQEKFDTSNFSPNHPSGIPTGINKKVPGMFKDEAGGEIIEEFVGLRAKLYAIKKLNGEEEKKCKGVKRGVVKKASVSKISRNVYSLEDNNYELWISSGVINMKSIQRQSTK